MLGPPATAAFTPGARKVSSPTFSLTAIVRPRRTVIIVPSDTNPAR